MNLVVYYGSKLGVIEFKSANKIIQADKPNPSKTKFIDTIGSFINGLKSNSFGSYPGFLNTVGSFPICIFLCIFLPGMPSTSLCSYQSAFL